MYKASVECIINYGNFTWGATCGNHTQQKIPKVDIKNHNGKTH